MNFFDKILIVLVYVLSAFYSCNGQSANNSKNDGPVVAKLSGQSLIDNKDTLALSKYINIDLLKRFSKEIQAFQTDDSLHPYRKADIVFSGSSSIRKWTTLENDMHGLRVLNRGFGGSTVPEAIYYADVLFFKYNPEKIVFYSGDNDIGFQMWNVDRVIQSYIYFCKILRSRLPNTQIYIISIKPSPARIKYWPKMEKVNEFLKSFAAQHDKCYYIDGASCFLDENGNVKKEYFRKDGVHLNQAGYKVWSRIIYNEIKD